MAEETAVIDSAPVDPAPVADAGVPDVSSAPDTAPIPDATGDSSDPFASLTSAMDSVLPKDDVAADPTLSDSAQSGEIPEQFAQALTISPYVTSAESVQQAVRAADEVWQVATGKIPARQMLEGFRNQNPAQFESIVADLKDYLGVQGQQAQQASPLDELKAANPQAFQQIAQYYQQQTGKSLDGPADPREARLQALEKRYQAEEEARNVAQWNQQIETARATATEFLNKTIANTFADGLADRFLTPNGGLLWQKAVSMNIDEGRMLNELRQGKTETLERVWKAVAKDEAAVIRRYNENLVKQHKTLKNAVPAQKGAAVSANNTPGAPARKVGESNVDYAKRLWESGFGA